MKRITFFIGLMVSVTGIVAQQIPTANTGGGRNNNNYWSREGNSNSGGGINNIFGTRYNSPIYTWTNHQYRMKLNGGGVMTTQYPINNYTFGNSNTTVNTTGYMLLGENWYSRRDSKYTRSYQRLSSLARKHTVYYSE